MKICTKCHIDKPKSGFYKHKGGKDGLSSRCKDCDSIMNAKYREDNPEEVKARHAKYRKDNPEKRKASQTKWYKANAEKANASSAKWLKNNPHKRRANNRRWQKEKLKTDSLFKLKRNLSCRTSRFFSKIKTNKPTDTKTLLGADWVEVKSYIEGQFTGGMTWENHGEWHIDHIIPLASAKHLDEIIPLCHYTNLQPLWAIDNIKKGCKTQGSLYHQTA